MVCDYFCKSRFAAAGRTEENYGGESVGLNCPPKQPPLSYNVFLTYVFVKI